MKFLYSSTFLSKGKYITFARIADSDANPTETLKFNGETERIYCELYGKSGELNLRNTDANREK